MNGDPEFRPAVFLPRLTAGGAERVMLALLGHWAARGVCCDLVTAQSGGPWTDRIPPGVRHAALGARRPTTAIPALASYLRASRPSALLSSIFPANIAAITAACIAGVPCVVREANWTADDLRGPTRMSTAVNRAALRLLYPRAARIIALTRGSANHLAEVAGIAGTRIDVIPNPAPAPAAAVNAAARDRWHVVACGRLEPQKDFPLLLEAFAQVCARTPARLTIIGDGSQRGPLEDRVRHLGIEDRVSMPGYCPDPQALLAQAGLFVLSSRWEGFPNILLESLAAGCPIVATAASDAVGDILDNGRFGTIVPPGDAAALAAAMSRALDRPEAPPSAAAQLARFALEPIAARYEGILREAARSRH